MFPPLLIALVSVLLATQSALWAARPLTPVIYCTDLFHPHEDPDDHFDLATLFALSELDVKLIVLDQGVRQGQRPGRIPVSQMNQLTGRAVPAVIGLGEKLRHPGDTGDHQPAELQEGVKAILRVLRAAESPVRLAAVGSMRDIVAAFNREPALFRQRVDMVLAFIGEASDPAFHEYNVDLDPQAYVGLMRSGLPVYWVPCFDGGLWQNHGHASFWKAAHETLIKDVRSEVMQYFIYALDRQKAPPLEFLSQPVPAEARTRLLAGTRNLWCTAIFGVMAGRKVIYDAPQNQFRWSEALPSAATAVPGELFSFQAIKVTVSDDGVVRTANGTNEVHRFEIRDRERYAEGMTAMTARLLAGLGRKN